MTHYENPEMEKAYRLGNHCGFCRADILPLGPWSLGREDENFAATHDAYLRGFADGEARALRGNYDRPELPQPRSYETIKALVTPTPVSRERKRALTAILSVTWDGPSLEDQIADIIADLTARRFHSESIILPPDNDGWVYIGSDYYGTIRKTNMSDRFRYTYDRGMNEPGSGTSRAVNRSGRK